MIISVDKSKLTDHIRGALIGTFVGDALGRPVEAYSFRAIEDKYGEIREMLPARKGKGTYTDDTQLMIGVAESLIECEEFDGRNMANKFVENYDPSRGYGGGTTKVLNLIKEGSDWDEAGIKVFDGGSFGNGAAMRSAPVGTLYWDDFTALKEVAEAQSQITHAHPLGKEGGVMLSLGVALAINTSLKEKDIRVESFINSILEHLSREEYIEKIKAIKTLLSSDPPVDEIIKKLGNDSRAHFSVPTALYAFLENKSSFEEAVVQAVGLGGDTDTIGAMTGAIAGAYHGFSIIPNRWLQQLEDGEKGVSYILELSDALAQLSTGES